MIARVKADSEQEDWGECDERRGWGRTELGEDLAEVAEVDVASSPPYTQPLHPGEAALLLAWIPFGAQGRTSGRCKASQLWDWLSFCISEQTDWKP